MTNARACSLALTMLAACADVEPASDPALGDTTQAISAVQGQGWDLQGWDLQGWDLQGWDLQGWDLQGWDLQGGYYSNAALTGASVTDTALEVWRTVYVFGQGYRSEQRRPDRKCIWSLDKTTLQSCTYPDLATEPSPLAGVKLKGTFRRSSGETIQAYVRIGVDTTTVGAVTRGFGVAMHALVGNSAVNTAGCGVVGQGGIIDTTTGETCMNPGGCRRNCDLWLYDIDVIMPDGQTVDGCRGTQKAVLVPGWYAADGSYTPSSTSASFSCESGTIAKCTRWGYRPFGAARKRCDHSTCSPTIPTTNYGLLDYHRSCVRAAMADYCANGFSFTKLGTLVDIYDYDPSKASYGFIPKTAGLFRAGLVPPVPGVPDGGTAFRYESSFDRWGASYVDYLRYEEVTPTLAGVCGSRFELGDSGDVLPQWWRPSPGPVTPMVSIDSTTGCAHSERTVGKWLHVGCTTCALKVSEVAPWCTDPSDPKGWNQDCVDAVDSRCAITPPMTTHSECSAGEPLPKFATGCTLRVCGKSDHASCCTSSWDATCVAVADEVCRGGQDTIGLRGSFCHAGAIVLPPPPPATTTSK